ncbi:MAG: hypothetical protein WC055_02025 [Melioribacteraceae bacterium]
MRLPPPDRTKYPFKTLNLNDSVVTEGNYRVIRICADGYRNRRGWMFLVKDLGEGKVEIKRYK